MGFVESDHVGYDLRDGVVWVTIDRPERRNALTTRMYAAIRDAFRRAAGDPAIDVVVVTGAGRDFAAGGDLGESMSIVESGDQSRRYAFVDSLPYDTVRTSPLTTIAMINGTCLGGALALAACTDLMVASDRARFGLPEARSGVFDPWGPEFLAPRISRTHLNFLIYTGEMVSAQQALAWNLVNEVVPHDRLEEHVLALIERVRRTTPQARAGYKRCITGRDVITPAVAATIGLGGDQVKATTTNTEERR
jgi:enoyl-CoA hydratase